MAMWQPPTARLEIANLLSAPGFSYAQGFAAFERESGVFGASKIAGTRKFVTAPRNLLTGSSVWEISC